MIFYNGHHYPTVKEIFELNAPKDLRWGLFVARRARGWDLHAALTTPPGPPPASEPIAAKPVVVLGESYPSVAAAFESLGHPRLELGAVSTRLSRGWSIEEALLIPPRKRGTVREYWEDHHASWTTLADYLEALEFGYRPSVACRVYQRMPAVVSKNVAYRNQEAFLQGDGEPVR